MATRRIRKTNITWTTADIKVIFTKKWLQHRKRNGSKEVHNLAAAEGASQKM